MSFFGTQIVYKRSMENILINYLLMNCAALAKEFSSQGKAATEQSGTGTLNFLSLLDGKMGMGVAPAADLVNETTSKEIKNDALQDDTQKESVKSLSDAQSVFALLQACMNVKGPQQTNLQNDQLIALENLLKNMFSLLNDGESVQFIKEKAAESLPLSQRSESDQKNTVNESKEQDAVDESKAQPLEPQIKMDFAAVINYLAAMMNQAAGLETTGSKEENVAVEKNGEKLGDNVNVPEIVPKKEVFPNFKKTDTPVISDNESKEIVNLFDASVKSFQNVEVKKIDGKNNMFQIVSHELTPRQDDGANKNISVPSVKTEKTLITDNSESPKVIFKVADKETANSTGKDESQLLPQNDYTKISQHVDKETPKVTEKAPFASLMTDKIEKIVEQYANKNVSMDMVVRLKIDDKETLLVGLKDQGQRVTVEVKTTSEGIGTFLQSQKEEITKQLEGKNIYANIYVDVNNEGYQKREQKEQQKKGSDEKEKQDFGVFLEASA